MTASMQLNSVCLDYLIKTGSDSLKKTIFHLFNGVFRRDLMKQLNVIRNQSFRALNNVTLQLKPGDRLGLLGRNGAGKSSLLRVMARIYQPSSGEIDIQGRISCLLDINLGFNLEATGYENIINLGIMRGWSHKEAEAVIEDVERFTGLGEFLKQPVRSYSSGMQVKLSFAVATSRVCDIMLVDEIIGVGDAAFMQKAQNRVLKLIDSAQIFVLTSHSKEIVERFCNKVAVMDRGEIKYLGDYQSGIEFYEAMLQQDCAELTLSS